MEMLNNTVVYGGGHTLTANGHDYILSWYEQHGRTRWWAEPVDPNNDQPLILEEHVVKLAGGVEAMVDDICAFTLTRIVHAEIGIRPREYFDDGSSELVVYGWTYPSDEERAEHDSFTARQRTATREADQRRLEQIYKRNPDWRP